MIKESPMYQENHEKRGRKKKDKITKMIPINIQVHPLIFSYLKEYDEKYGINKSRFVRESLEDALKYKVYNELIDIYTAHPKEGDINNKFLQETLRNMTAIELIKRLETLKEKGLTSTGKEIF